MNLKTWIKENLFNSIGNLNQKKINSLVRTNHEKFLELMNKSKEFGLTNIRETIYWILNDIKNAPVCLKCKKKLIYNNNIHNGYTKFCSSLCSNSSEETKNAKEESFKRKYGSRSLFQIPEVLQRTKEKHLERYGVENPFQSEEIKEKMRETWREKYGVDWSSKSPIIREKIEKTNLNKYGVRCVFESKEFQERIKQIHLEKRGVEYPTQSPEVIETRRKNNLKMYGVKNIFELPEIKQKIKETCREKYGVDYTSQSNEVKLKTKNTMLKNYGCWYSKTQEYRNMRIEKNDETQQKIYETKKKNNTFNKSKIEDNLYKLLIQKFPNTIRQYKSIDYPWVCDFYIPEKDLYIEYLGTWTHGNKPYDLNDKECLKLVEKFKQKSEEVNFKGKKKKFYLNAITTWTKLDVAKRAHAKEHKLNFLEFFNEKEFNDWFENE